MNKREVQKFLAALISHQDIFRRIPSGPGQWATKNPDEAIDVFAEALANHQAASPILRCISSDVPAVVIPATSGKGMILSATEVFESLDPDFKHWGLNLLGEARPETPVEVYELARDGKFEAIFRSLERDLENLCFTQEQIVAFVRDRTEWLRPGGFATFFLLKSGGNNFFVVRVWDGDCRPCVCVDRLSFDYVWFADCRHRIVVPSEL